MASNEDDDDDLKRAIAMSLEEAQGSTTRQAIVLDEDEDSSKPSNLSVPSQGAGFLGLDRKNMEQERLNRKRKASPTTSSHLVQTTSRASEPVKRQKSGGDPIFLDGVVRKTFALGYSRDADAITLEYILDRDDLQLAVLSSFQWDIPWLFAKLDISKTLITLVMQAKDEAKKEQYRRETSYLPKLRLCFPNMEGQINCMHSKLMLLSHPKYLRIVIPTANLVSYDWGETGTTENMCFIIDLPRLPDEQRSDTLTFFGEEMLHFLRAQGLEKSIIHSLNKFDFSATKDLAFVHTIGGAHMGHDEPWRRTGYCGLGRAVQSLGLATQEKINVDFVTSSVGSLNTDFLSTIYQACQGTIGGKVANPVKNGNSGSKSKSKSRPAPTPAVAAVPSHTENHPVIPTAAVIEQYFRIYFPTRDTVRNSRAGSAGTICFQSKWYHSPTFPKDIMRDCKSVRKGLLMHNKLMFVRPSTSSSSSSSSHQQQQPQDDLSSCWAYIGSANCSESAWGKLSTDRVSKLPKLNCRNWECGVLIPARSRKSQSRACGGGSSGGKRDGDEDGNLISSSSSSSVSLGETFRGVVPVPMVWPGEEYGARKPWFFMED